MVINHRRLRPVYDLTASTAIMRLDSTEDGFCQQEDWGCWMIAIVSDMGKRDGIVPTGVFCGIAKILQQR
jgi:hypothetical protein